jgi:hypothetical protein
MVPNRRSPAPESVDRLTAMDPRWLVSGAAAAGVVGLVAALGGFAPASIRVPAAGTTTHLARWDVTPLRAELVDGDDPDEPQSPTVRVWFTLTVTGPESLSAPWGLAEVVLPDGRTPEATSWFTPAREGGFDPDVPRQAYLELEAPEPGWTGDRPLGLRLFDERRSDSPAPIEIWAKRGPVEVLELVCEDRR